jgi:hypothetical protein
MYQHASQAVPPATEHPAQLRALVLYEDFPAGQRAKCLLDRLSPLCCFEIELTMKLWRFELLNLPLELEQAAIEAAEADIILLSVSRKTKMLAEDQEWLIRWLDHKRDQPYLVCLLSNAPADEPGADVSWAAALESFIRKAGADFIRGTFPAPSPALEARLGDLRNRAHCMTGVLEGILNRDAGHWPYSPWQQQA